MNQRIFQLAYRQFISFKKHYLLIAGIVFVVTVGLLSSMLIFENQYQVKKEYEISQYGTWYTKIENIDSEIKYWLERFIEQVETPKEYGYIYQQGYQDDYHIAGVSSSIYHLCHIELSEGNTPTQENEIVVTSTLAKQENVRIGDTLLLNIYHRDQQQYTIVGIVDITQDFLPDIYTSILEGYQEDYYCDTRIGYDTLQGTYYISFSDVNGVDLIEPLIITLPYRFNPHGYDQDTVNQSFQYSLDQIYISFEIICICAFILFILTSSSLKRRQKEFSLLRGIGMTTKQLILMVLYENILTVSLSVLLGMIVSLGVGWIYMHYIEHIYHIFAFFVSSSFFIYAFLLMIIQILVTLIPIYISSHKALSGSFDDYRFQYIQVRYRKLKKQTKYRLALRELLINKKMNISFIIFMMAISLTFVIYLYKDLTIKTPELPQDYYNHLECTTASIEAYDKIKAIDCPEKLLIHQAQIPTQKTIVWDGIEGSLEKRITYVDDKSSTLSYRIVGNMPTSPHEVLVSENTRIRKEFLSDDYPDCHEGEYILNGKTYYIDVYYDMGDGNYAYSGTSSAMQIGDTFKIEDEDYTIVGKVVSSQLPSFSFLMLEEDYDAVVDDEYMMAQLYFETDQQKSVILKQLIQFDDVEYVLYQYGKIADQSLVFEDYIVEPQYLILPFLVGLVLCYMFNQNYMMNHLKDFSIYQIIGMTKKDLFKKQMCKAILMSGICFLMIIIYCLIIMLGYHYYCFPVIPIMMAFVCIFIFLMIVYCLPLIYIFKQHYLDVIHQE